MSAALRLPAATAQIIRRAAAASPKSEICGLLVETGGEFQAHVAPNRHPNPARGFAICDAFHARLQRQTRKRGGRIAGCFHSHPSGDTAPSQTDLLAAHDNGFLWLICAPDGRMEAWRADVEPGFKSFEPLQIEILDIRHSPIAAVEPVT